MTEPALPADPVRCRRCGGPLEIVKLMYGSIWSHIHTQRQFCRCPHCDTLNDPDFPSTRCDYCADALTDGSMCVTPPGVSGAR